MTPGSISKEEKASKTYCREGGALHRDAYSRRLLPRPVTLLWHTNWWIWDAAASVGASLSYKNIFHTPHPLKSPHVPSLCIYHLKSAPWLSPDSRNVRPNPLPERWQNYNNHRHPAVHRGRPASFSPPMLLLISQSLRFRIQTNSQLPAHGNPVSITRTKE